MELKRLLLFLLLCPFYRSAQGQEPKKFALLVGISNFEDKNWPTLHGKEEVATLLQTLQSKGFPEGNILLCTDEQATKEHILSLFRDLQARVGRGSMVYIHFSMHEQQILDDDTNPQEESDGLDECLIPYDCLYIGSEKNIAPETAYRGDKHLRDDDIGTLTDDLRSKIGPEGQLVVVVDACHAGTSTRSTGAGANIPILWFGAQPPKEEAERVNPLHGERKAPASHIAPMLAIFAALQGENTRDTVFFSAVNESLKKAEPYTTCSAFFENIKSVVNGITTLLVLDNLDIKRGYFLSLNERQRRRYAAVEAHTLGRGGIKAVHDAFGIDPVTIRTGLRELKDGTELPPGRIRRSGGGRKKKQP